ncbi:MAG: hypothetical protein DBX45_00590 [Oscillospiraceae bacterium]|nr:MAG: hypothetical protein DBX45_00590 [Oscillospiraceae bacterium]
MPPRYTYRAADIPHSVRIGLRLPYRSSSVRRGCAGDSAAPIDRQNVSGRVGTCRRREHIPTAPHTVICSGFIRGDG